MRGNYMEEIKCKFCKQLKDAKEDFEYHSSKRPSMKEDCKTKVTVSLVDNNYFRDEYSGRASFDMGTPKFCPLCGRKFSDDELQW